MGSAFQKLGRYLIVGEIATGGMATVYRAKLIGVEGFEKDVAIKKILPHWSDSQEFVNMLIDEAKILVHLQHSNIVQVFELAREKDAYFIVIEYVDGYDLRKILNKLKSKGEGLPLNLACFIVKEICRGLNFAHSRTDPSKKPLNIVHRDISPQNILISSEGSVKITDFGIARIIGKSTETAAGTLKGKFSYMSPEQALGMEINHLSDIFALGSVFYELVHLKKSFDGKNDLEVIEKVKSSTVDFHQDCPQSLRLMLTKALHKKQTERFESGMQFRHAIEVFEREMDLSADGHHLKDFLNRLFEDEITVREEAEKAAVSKTNLYYDTVNRLPTAATKIMSLDEKKDAGLKGPQKGSSGITVLQSDTVIDSQIVKTVQTEEPAKQQDPGPEILKTNPALRQPASQKNKKGGLRQILQGSVALLILLTAGMGLFFLLNRDGPDAVTEKTNNKQSLPDRNDLFMQDLILKQAEITDAEKDRKTQSDKLRASINLAVEPKDARIEFTLDGKDTAVTGKFTHEFEYKNQAVSIPVTITHEGYKPETLTLNLDKEHLVVNQTVKLEPVEVVKGKVKVTARPWGNASISNGSAGATPAVLTAPVGEQTVRVYYPPQKKRVSQRVRVQPNGVVRCEATFSLTTQYMSCK